LFYKIAQKMNHLAQHKISLIAWIANLQDISLLQRLVELYQQENTQKEHTLAEQKIVKRKAGWGKKIISYVSEDFDDTPDCFNEYMQK